MRKWKTGDGHPKIHRRITGEGRKLLDGCIGPYPTSCRAAFQKSRFSWCAGCRQVA